MTEHDPIEALLKATGPRPAIPEDRRDRVRHAVHAGWQAELARRARQRRARWGIALGAAAVVVAAVGLSLYELRPPIPLEPSGVRVERVVNEAWTRHRALGRFRDRAPLAVGSILARESQVTTSAGALAALRVPTGHSVRLDGDTTVRVISSRWLSLERGAVYVDSGGNTSHGAAAFRVETPLGTIEDRGTQFLARFDEGALTVRVREGAVTVQTSSERIVTHAGEAIRIDPAGQVERTESAKAGEPWAFAEGIAPMMAIEGRTLQEFLDWVVRERGVRLRFEGDGLAGRAPGILLRGSIEGMTLEEAAASVLATSGLAGRWESDALVVSR